MLMGLMLFFVGNIACESFTMRFSFLIVLSGIVLFLLGWVHFKILLFPIAFLIFMIPIAIFVNSLRVTSTGILANYYGTSVAQGFFHGFSGYLLFLVAFGLLVGEGFLLSKFQRQ